MKKVIIVLSFLLIFSNAYSNNADSILSKKNTELTDTTTECTVKTVSKVTYKEVNLFGLSDSTVNILKENLSKEILIKDIKSIKFKGGGFWNGALIGAGTAFVLGYVTVALADTADEEFKNGSVFLNGLLVGAAFTLPLGLLGGLIGAVVPKDHIFNFKKPDFEANRMTLKYIFKKYSNK